MTMHIFDITGPMPPLSALEGGWPVGLVMIGVYVWLAVKVTRYFKS